jgi:hypothetical protein
MLLSKENNYIFSTAKHPTVISIPCRGLHGGHLQDGVVTAMISGQKGADSIRAVVLMSPAAALSDNALSGIIFGKTYNVKTPPDSVNLGGGMFLGKDYILAVQKLPIYETARRYGGPTLIIHGPASLSRYARISLRQKFGCTQANEQARCRSLARTYLH